LHKQRKEGRKKKATIGQLKFNQQASKQQAEATGCQFIVANLSGSQAQHVNE